MKFVQIYSDRKWADNVISAGTMTTGELVSKLKDLPADLPVVFVSGGYYWGLHNDPTLTQKEF